MRDYRERRRATCGGCALRFAVPTRLGEVGVCVRDVYEAEDMDALLAMQGELPYADEDDNACESWEDVDRWA